MSQQQCLPVLKRRKLKKSEKKKLKQELSFFTIEDSQVLEAKTYLAAVRAEATNLPVISVASNLPIHNSFTNGKSTKPKFNPIDGSIPSFQYLISDKNSLCLPSTRSHLPRGIILSNSMDNGNGMSMKEWVDLTLSNFSTLRAYIDRCRQAGLGAHENERVLFPNSKDSSGWHIFCLGQDEASGNIGGYFHDDDQEEKKTNEINKNITESKNESNIHFSSTNEHEWNSSTVPYFGHPPSTKILCQFDQILTRRVIYHHVYYLTQGWKLTHSRGQWLYALLSRLEKPLHRNEESMLREILKKLCQIRANIDIHTALRNCSRKYITGLYQYSNMITLSVVNILITIVGIYFEQGEGFNSIMTIQSHKT